MASGIAVALTAVPGLAQASTDDSSDPAIGATDTIGALITDGSGAGQGSTGTGTDGAVTGTDGTVTGTDGTVTGTDGTGTGGTPTLPGTGGTPTLPGTGGTPTLPGTGGTPTLPGTGGTPTLPGTGGTGTGGTGTGGTGTGDTGTPPKNDQLRGLLDQLGAGAGFSKECTGGIASAIELIGQGLTTPPVDPEDAQDVLTQLQGALTAGEPDPAAVQELLGQLQAALDPENNDVARGLQLLAETLAEECMPEGGGDEGTPVDPVDNGTDVPPATEQPAPVYAAPVTSPVAYLGYAPTGADSVRADDTSVPLTALGGGLVLVAAGAAGYGMRGRAVRTRD